jgi:uncharacterized 2Fe-2S/4Fe-4S cluster protein (DUF4445 family)
MANHRVHFENCEAEVLVPTGTLVVDAARRAGIEIGQPCGGQGRCGRCTVQVTGGTVRRRSTLRLSTEDLAQGYALACQSVIEGDVTLFVPPQEKIERRLTTDRVALEVQIPAGYDPCLNQTVRRIPLSLVAPSMDDQRDDWSRLSTAIRSESGIAPLTASLVVLQKLGEVLRAGDWQVTAVLDVPQDDGPARLIDLLPGLVPETDPLWGIAVDIGTTTVTLWLVDLITGRVEAQASEYNGQISRGEDVISRIVYASKNGGLQDHAAPAPGPSPGEHPPLAICYSGEQRASAAGLRGRAGYPPGRGGGLPAWCSQLCRSGYQRGCARLRDG